MKFFKSFTGLGSKILVVEHDNGQDFYREFQLEPTLYTYGDGGYENIYGKPLKPVKFADTQTARDFANQLGDRCYGFDRFPYAFINEMYGHDFDETKIRGVGIDIENAVDDKFPDIETADIAINCLSMYFNGKIFTYTTLDVQGLEIPDVRLMILGSEKELLAKFLQHWCMIRPDYVFGWNSEGYDAPYLARRIERILGKSEMKRLSPFGVVRFNKDDENGRISHSVDIAGVENLDLLVLYKKFRLITRESYKLDAIAEIELGDNKIDFEGSFKDFYTKDPQRFVEYNAHDIRLVKKLDDKLNFISMVMSIAYISKTNYSDALSNVRLWDALIHNYLLDKKVCVPFRKPHGGDGAGYEGAFVKDPIRGFYEWVVSFDLESLYPSIIIQNNISPETVLPKETWPSVVPGDIVDMNDRYIEAKRLADKYDATLSGNGVLCSRKKQGFVPILADDMFNRRKSAKKQMIVYNKELELIESEILRRGVDKP
jgi:DNA polymerase elongation subunit (family B)